MPKKKGNVRIELPLSKEEILRDYRLAYQSRQASLIGRREVLSGKAKFGIFGDGKELANLAIARAFRKGDWRSGYYRDQTWMFMAGVMSIQEFFAQLYSHADLAHDPATGGRSMNAHFASRNLNPDGSWRDQTQMYNVAADVSPTAAQMPRAVGLAYASVLYRNLPELLNFKNFSNNGNEVTFATIGNASTAEGLFWESVNAIGVLKAPAVLTIYDDGYGISVPNQFQMVKENIGTILQGFQRDPCPDKDCDRGYDLTPSTPGIIPPCSKPTPPPLTSRANITSLPWCTSSTSPSRRDIPPRAATSVTSRPSASNGNRNSTA